MPKFTKLLFCGSLGLTLVAHFGLISPYSLTFDPMMIWHKFEVPPHPPSYPRPRPATCRVRQEERAAQRSHKRTLAHSLVPFRSSPRTVCVCVCVCVVPICMCVRCVCVRSQIWRLVTCVFFFGKVGFPFLINVYFLYSYSVRLETELYERKPADYATMLLTTWLVMLCCAYFFDLMVRRSRPLRLSPARPLTTPARGQQWPSSSGGGRSASGAYAPPPFPTPPHPTPPFPGPSDVAHLACHPAGPARPAASGAAARPLPPARAQPARTRTRVQIVGPILVMAILYTWCYVNKDTIVSFYFGTSFPAMYLPWALLGFNILLGGT